MPTVGDFSFLSEDLRRQRELAQKALDEAKRIDDLIDKSADEHFKAELTKAKEKLLEIASGLAANATHTSTAATITFSGVGRMSVDSK
jgi:hypothetical protein